MAEIMIDGYNLIGIQHGNIEAERARLVEGLSEYGSLRGHQITVVFDGWRGGGPRATHQLIGGVNVIYSPLGQKADALMDEMLSASPTSWIVVSSDREVEASAWAGDSVPVESAVFMRILERTLRQTGAPNYHGGADEYEPDDDEYNEQLYSKPQRKGNAYKPSRKQKAIDRALAKL